jgi:haloalkane dehalogenase
MDIMRVDFASRAKSRPVNPGMRRFGIILFLLVLSMVQLLPGSAALAQLPVPSAQRSFAYSLTFSPELSASASRAQPIGVGPVAAGGDTVEIRIGLDAFSAAVDIYFLVSASASAAEPFLLTTRGELRPLSEGGLEPWKEEFKGSLDEPLFGPIPVSLLPPDTYLLYLAVAPAGALDRFVLWTTHFESPPRPCDSPPLIRTTADGVRFLRTPESCFKDLPGFPYKARYMEIQGLRQAYVDEGPVDGEPVLLLHGQPSWSYLYRKMIPALVAAGHRVIAMDHLGMGRSDKPMEIEDYSYLGHIHRLERFIRSLDLKNITLFCQDWGSLIGLHVAGTHPDWFARIVVGNGTLPVIPAGLQPYPAVENPNEVNDDLSSIFSFIPDEQPPFYDEQGNRLLLRDPAGFFGQWMVYAMTAAAFHPAEVLEAMTYFALPVEVEAAYDAPFPSRVYMAGPRVFPSLVNELPGVNEEAWIGLGGYEKPFLTIWASNDPGNLGGREVQNQLIDHIPGAAGQPHTRLPAASHFLQEDQGEEIARRIVEFMVANPLQGTEEPEPRGFYVIGDSWSAVPSRYNTFETCLAVRNLGHFTVHKHAVSGSTAAQWASAAYPPAETFLRALRDEPNSRPVVYFTLGANDLRSTDNEEALRQEIRTNLSAVVDRILAARPDARIIMASMDSLNPAIAPSCEAAYNAASLNHAFQQLAVVQAQVAANHPEAFAANVMGTLQGNPGSPDLTQPAPLEYIGDCLHLNAEGYELVVGRALDLTLAGTDFLGQ